jgi:hypothetical protein
VGSGWLFLWESDVIVAADEIESFTTKGLGFEITAKL